MYCFKRLTHHKNNSICFPLIEYYNRYIEVIFSFGEILCNKYWLQSTEINECNFYEPLRISLSKLLYTKKIYHKIYVVHTLFKVAQQRILIQSLMLIIKVIFFLHIDDLIAKIEIWSNFFYLLVCSAK